MEGGEISFPPQVLLHVWPEGCEKVVGVHDDVHQRVERPAERLLASGQPTGQRPPEDGHDSMMNNLKMI